ncbi:immunoglobulin mu heavy chain isoform X2 [Kryptolebias marmoratus]|nr:immunoglobulin mu heavy chain isoform X2 [Kryptolebias marmoratus]
MVSVTLLLLFAAGSYVTCEQLTQPASVTVQPGQRLTITCQVSYSVTGYWTAWIRQPAGEGLEWIGSRVGGSTSYKDSLKNKFSIDLDSSSNTVTLNGQNMQPEDSAVYYCARDPQWTQVYHCDDYFDYWGKGTQVTVTSADSKGPTLFPLLPCGSGGRDTVTLGCLATGFTPSPLTFSWKQGSTTLNDFITYPPIQKGSEYIGISQLEVKKQDWDAKKSFECFATHAVGEPHVLIVKPVVRIVSPNITLYPVWKGEFGVSQVRLICTLSGFFPKTLKVEWLQGDQKPADIKGTETNLQSSDGEETTYSLITEIEPNMEEWKKGSSFTCKGTHNHTEFEESLSICQIHKSNPPSIHLEIPTFKTVMMSESDVKATCFIRNVFDAKLTWLMDEKQPSDDKAIPVTNSTFIINELMVLPNVWKSLRTLKCKAEHPCFSAEKAEKVSGPAVSPPQVEIRWSLPDLLNGGGAVLLCDITQLSSQDLYVTFQAKGVKGVTTTDRQYVELPEGSGPHSVSRKWSVPKEYWTNDTSFTCSVQQGFSSSSSNLNSISNIFEDPSVQILIPSEESGQQNLVCSGRGLNPQVKWLLESKPVSSLPNDVSVDKNGRVAATSQLHVPQKKWKTGKVFTCEVSDSSLSKTVRKNISFCSVTPTSSHKVGVYVQGPPLEQLQKKGQLTLSCLLVGTGLSDFLITWKVDGVKSPPRTVRTEQPVGHSNGTETLQSFINVSTVDWLSYKNVSCKGKHRCSSEGFEVSISKTRVVRPPVVRIVQPSASDGFTITCLVSGFNPPNIIVQWKKKDQTLPSSRYINSPPWKEPGMNTFSMRSKLNMTSAEDNRSAYTCVALHESSKSPVNESVKDVFDVIDNCPFFDEIKDADVSEDSLKQTWSLALTFLILFLFAIMFSVIVTFMKIK